MTLNLEYLTQIAKSICGQFGKHCEVVIFDVVQKDFDYAIVYIQNGHISGRKVGDGCSEGLKAILQENPQLLQDKIAYLNQGAENRILKSTSTYLREKDGKIRYIMEINYDITQLCALEFGLNEFTQVEKKEKSSVNVHKILDELLEQSVEIVGKPVSLMNKEEKIRAIDFLDQSGAFLITKAGEKMGQFFGISKFTLYSYLEAGKEGNRGQKQ